MIKTLSKLRIEGNYLNIIDAFYEKLAIPYPVGERLKTFHLRSEMREGCHLHHFYSTQ